MLSTDEVLKEAEKASEGKQTRTAWTGVLSINVPTMNLNNIEYHVKAGKVKGDMPELVIKKIDKTTGREVVSKEVVRLYRYKENEQGERAGLQEVSYDEGKQKVRFIDSPTGELQNTEEWNVSAKLERRFFDKELLEVKGLWEEITADRITDKQDGEEVAPFDRTQRLDVEETNIVQLSRVNEYKFHDLYMIVANLKEKEQSSRVKDLARYLLEKQVGLLCFFSWGLKGYKYYTTVIYPYERAIDGKLWLCMGLSEGILQFDPIWSLEAAKETEAVPVPTIARPKPKVKISK